MKPDAREVADLVARTALIGAPELLLVDEGALGAEGTPDGDDARRVVAALGLEVVPVDGHAPTLRAPSVGVFARAHPPVTACHAWYVGRGPAPTWMSPTDGGGTATAVRLLRLLGTALAQERAGTAFRAASSDAGGDEGRTRAVDFDPGLLRGVDVTLVPGAVVAAPSRIAVDRDLLLRRAFRDITRCCADSGAIAAAPRRTAPDQPDYWFFWQRDAAAVAVALHDLALDGPADLRAEAAERAAAYVGFVVRLGPALAEGVGVGVSRCSVEGEPVGGYGDPQHDGPAATALAVMALVSDPAEALAVAAPFLDHLVGGAADEPGFDLWELTVGHSFHAGNLRRRALVRAADLAAPLAERVDPADGRIADREAALRAAAARVADRLLAHRTGDGALWHVLDPTPAWFGATSRLDLSVLGSSLLASEANDFLADEIAETTARVVAASLDRWPVNRAWRGAGHLGGGLGRFPEDGNDGRTATGGHPWPITTLWAARHHHARGEVDLAHGYLDFVLSHGEAGSEQIDGATGQPRGAAGLAWARAELVTTVLALRR